MRRLSAFALTLLLLTGATAMTRTPAAADVVVTVTTTVAPPPLPVYDQPPIPGPDYIWTPGYWSWDSDEDDYFWVPGTWVEAPEHDVVWTPGYWEVRNSEYVFIAGYWGAHCGYYGGINYGFGYTGNGYEGGYWQDGHFFYNRSVNNITNVNITNVYNKTVVVNNTTINRVSFNGPGGTTVRPTQEQLAIARDRHVEPTARQLQQRQAARANPALFASRNHGRPTIAATAKPGVFSGEGINAGKPVGPLYQPARPPHPHGSAAPPTATGAIPAAQTPAKPAPSVATTPKRMPNSAVHTVTQRKQQPHQQAALPVSQQVSHHSAYVQREVQAHRPAPVQHVKAAVHPAHVAPPHRVAVVIHPPQPPHHNAAPRQPARQCHGADCHQ